MGSPLEAPQLPTCKALTLALQLWLSTIISLPPAWAVYPGRCLSVCTPDLHPRHLHCLRTQTVCIACQNLSHLSPSALHGHCLYLAFLVLLDNGSGFSIVIEAPGLGFFSLEAVCCGETMQSTNSFVYSPSGVILLERPALGVEGGVSVLEF